MSSDLRVDRDVHPPMLAHARVAAPGQHEAPPRRTSGGAPAQCGERGAGRRRAAHGALGPVQRDPRQRDPCDDERHPDEPHEPLASAAPERGRRRGESCADADRPSGRRRASSPKRRARESTVECPACPQGGGVRRRTGGSTRPLRVRSDAHCSARSGAIAPRRPRSHPSGDARFLARGGARRARRPRAPRTGARSGARRSRR